MSVDDANISDSGQDLMARLQAGDASAIEDIDTRYRSELRLFCQRMVYNEALAEDIVQDVLMTCCRVDASQKPTGSLRGWLYRIARNKSIDELRRMRPKARLSALQSSQQIWMNAVIPIDPATTPAGKAIKHDQVRKLQLAIDAMEDGLREVVILYFFQGLSRAEVAEAIGLTLAGTKARLSKAMQLLRQKLQATDDATT